MSFIDGLKNMFKETTLAIIMVVFIIDWILILLAATLIPDISFVSFLFLFIGFLVGFTLILFIISIFLPIEKMSKYVIIIALIITLPFLLIFNGFVTTFYGFLIIANQFLTAFFAFKLCMDYSTKVDDWLYNKKDSRKYTRVIEFFLFGFLSWWILRLQLILYQAIDAIVYYIFLIIFIINVVLMAFVIIRLIITKKFSAYITLFFILTLFYALYMIIDIWVELFFPGSSIEWYTFFVDIGLFLYIIGSIYDKVDFIEDKLKVIRADTIALFVIMMKLFVQVLSIAEGLPWYTSPPDIQKEIGILVIFIGFTLLFGIYSIFVHKEGKTEKK